MSRLGQNQLLFSDVLNTRVCRTTKKTPFEIVFNQTPNNIGRFDFAAVPGGPIMEEDIAHLLKGEYD